MCFKFLSSLSRNRPSTVVLPSVCLICVLSYVFLCFVLVMLVRISCISCLLLESDMWDIIAILENVDILVSSFPLVLLAFQCKTVGSPESCSPQSLHMYSLQDSEWRTPFFVRTWGMGHDSHSTPSALCFNRTIYHTLFILLIGTVITLPQTFYSCLHRLAWTQSLITVRIHKKKLKYQYHSKD